MKTGDEKDLATCLIIRDLPRDDIYQMLRGGDICDCVVVAARVREIPAVASLNERRGVVA